MFNFSKKSKNNISINGVNYEVEGNNITMKNNKLYVDGVLVNTIEKLQGDVKIIFEGDLANLKTDGAATVNGNVKGYVDSGGSANISGSVGSYVDAGGSVNCGSVNGKVDAGGSVTCGSVAGKVDAGGSIRMNK